MAYEIDKVLKNKPTLSRILQCCDLLSYFQTNQTNLTKFLTTESVFAELIATMHTSKDLNLVRRIHILFLSNNTSLIQFLFSSRNTIFNFINVFSSAQNTTPAVQAGSKKITVSTIKPVQSKAEKFQLLNLALCFDVLTKLFLDYPNEMYPILNSSDDIAILLISNINLLPIFTFCVNLVTDSDFSQTFAWYAYRCLMGPHGTGGPAPILSCHDNLTSCRIPMIPMENRIYIIQLLTQFFTRQNETSMDFSRSILLGIPLLIQKALNDTERCYIFELSLLLPLNDAMIRFSKSILFSFSNNDRLIELSLRYLTLFPAISNFDDLELLVFDILTRHHKNNFVLIGFLNFFKKQTERLKISNLFIERIRNVINFTSQVIKSNVMTHAFGADILNFLGHRIYNIAFFKEQVKKQRQPVTGFDADRIKILKGKLAQNDKKQPMYLATQLWGPKATIYEAYFNSVNNEIKQQKLTERIDEADDLLSDDDNEKPYTKPHNFMISMNQSMDNLNAVSHIPTQASPKVMRYSQSKTDLQLQQGNVIDSLDEEPLINAPNVQQKKINQSTSVGCFKHRKLECKNAPKRNCIKFKSPSSLSKTNTNLGLSKSSSTSNLIQKKTVISQSRSISTFSSVTTNQPKTTMKMDEIKQNEAPSTMKTQSNLIKKQPPKSKLKCRA